MPKEKIGKEAHLIVQEIDHPDGAWVHAYLIGKKEMNSMQNFGYNLADKISNEQFS